MTVLAPVDLVVAGTAHLPRRQLLQAMAGLALSLFVALLSATVVATALPAIVADLGGGTSGYTWVVTSTLLTMTVSTPLWGKLSDLVSRKVLMQAAITIFLLASVVAGFTMNLEMLIAARALQGVGAGGVVALTQVVMASLVSPRERGRYGGYLSATFAVATVAGPLLGGLLVDSRLGWRSCFFVGVPIAVVALVVLQRTLTLPMQRRDVHLDWLGATLLTGGVSALLVWVTLGGQTVAWMSPWSGALVALVLALLAGAVVVELRHREPVVPIALFRQRSLACAAAAVLMTGAALHGATVHAVQYFQLGRAQQAIASGLLTMPMILGLAVSSFVVGRLVTRTGRYKPSLVVGCALAMIGFLLLSQISGTTGLPLVSVALGLVGIGLGATNQNLLLAVQNTTAARDLGAVTGSVSFFRALGGPLGVGLLGAVVAHQVSARVVPGLARLDQPAGALGENGTAIPDLAALPDAVARLVGSAYGSGAGTAFALLVPVMAAALVCVLLLPEVPLRTTLDGSGEDEGE